MTLNVDMMAAIARPTRLAIRAHGAGWLMVDVVMSDASVRAGPLDPVTGTVV
jgi:hypothetical protein